MNHLDQFDIVPNLLDVSPNSGNEKALLHNQNMPYSDKIAVVKHEAVLIIFMCNKD